MRLAYFFAFSRGLLSVVFAIALVAVPEKMMPGSSAEPARTLAVFLSSRLLVVGLSFIVLTALRQRKALSVFLFVDAGLQVFDLSWPLLHGQRLSSAVVPLVLGALGVWAGLRLKKADV